MLNKMLEPPPLPSPHNRAIKASFRWSVDEFLKAQHVHMQHSEIGRKLRNGTYFVAPFGIILGLFILYNKGVDHTGIVMTVVGFSLLFSPLLTRHYLRRHYATRSDRDMVVDWEITSEVLASKTEASSGEFHWRMLTKVLQTNEGFFLYPSDQAFHWLPVHAFQSADEVKRFSELARAKVSDFRRVT